MDMVYVPLTTYDSDMKHLVLVSPFKEKLFIIEANLIPLDNLVYHSRYIIDACSHGHILNIQSLLQVLPI